MEAGVEGGPAAAEITASGAGSHGIYALDDNTILNLGSIAVTGDDSNGIEVGDDYNIVNRGTVSAAGLNGIGVLLGAPKVPGEDEQENELANFGTIIGGSGSGAAISLSLPDSEIANLVTNRVGGVIDGFASGVAILGSAGADTVRNRGTITGDVRLEGGDDFFGLSEDGVIDGVVYGGTGRDTARLLGSGPDVLDLSIFSEFEVLEVVEAGTWMFSGEGSFPEGTAVMQDRTFNPVALDGTVKLTGDYVQGENTGLFVRINPDKTNDRLVIEGNAVIEEGTSLWLAPSGQLVDDATIRVPDLHWHAHRPLRRGQLSR